MSATRSPSDVSPVTAPGGPTFQPLTVFVGATVHDIDLSEPLDETTVATLKDGLAEYGVLLFPGQGLSPREHREVALRFGDINPPHDRLPTLEAEGVPEVSVISTEVGNAYAANHWHADVTWMEEPSQYSMLNMRVSPPVGGDTLWLSQTAAFEHLSPAVQDLVLPLTAEHRMRPTTAPVTHPVVIRHPRTGRRALFVNPLFTRRIHELEPIESDAVLRMLFDVQRKPDWTVGWKWTAGDFGVWDNHFVLHYATSGYEGAREINRIEVATARPLSAS